MSNSELNDFMAQNPYDGIKLRGFFRVQIEDEQDGIVGDSGWQENVITNLGFLNVVNQLGTSLTGSKHSHLALGTGGAPASNATSLPNEVVVRAALTAASSGSTALQMTATFASSASFVTATEIINNIGVFGSVSAGTLLSGNTYASSSCATNQAVNATYTWTFS